MELVGKIIARFLMAKDPIQPKHKLILISPTAGTMAGFEMAGFSGRQITLVREYAKYFDVEYYTSDVKDYSGVLHVKHRPIPIRLDIPGVRHLLFWLYLVIRAPFMKGTIRTFGVEIPTLPLVRILSRQKLIAGFQWDYASQTHANYTGVKKWLANSLQDLGFRGTDLVICTMEWLKNIAEQKYKKRAVVLPNFVDVSVFKKSDDKENYIIYTGRLHWSKGVEFLLTAFKEVVKSYPDYRLLICGAGESERSLREMVTEEIASRVAFLGSIKQDQLAPLLAKAKVFVLPTFTYEGHPKALIEAMASGTACVATKVPGNKDVIIDNITGRLVEPKDSRRLAKVLLEILGSDELRTRFESAGRDFAMNHYDLKRIIEQERLIISKYTGQC